jgi:hypothetical protein
MGEEVGTSDGAGDVGNDKTPRKIPAQSQVEVERQPAICMDGSAISRAEVIVDAGMQIQRQSVRKIAEVGSRVHEEPVMSVAIGDKEAAGGGRANVHCRRRSPSEVSLPMVRAEGGSYDYRSRYVDPRNRSDGGEVPRR